MTISKTEEEIRYQVQEIKKERKFEEIKEVYCSYCGTKLTSDDLSCPFCGVSIEEHIEEIKAEIKIVSQGNKRSNLRAEIKKLKEKYTKLTEVKEDLKRAKSILEQKREELLQVVVDGFPPIDLNYFEEAVKNEKVRVEAQKSLVRIAEKAAKKRFPERFNFL